MPQKHIYKLACTVLFVLCFHSALSQEKPRATDAQLAEISERGRLLAEYDVAAWHATDAVVALKPVDGSVSRYVAKKEGGKWVVAFGVFNEKRDKFLINYEAVQGDSPTQFHARKLDSSKEDTSFYLFAARALETAIGDFKGEQRPYNAAVLPGIDRQLWVYVLPAQTETGIYPVGGDSRYLISSDGLKILEARRMHKSIIEFDLRDPTRASEGLLRTAVLDEVPEDSDVFYVLTRTRKIPDLIVTAHYAYQVKIDGSIVFIMTKEKFEALGKGKQ